MKVASKAAESRGPPAAAISLTPAEPHSQQQSKKKGPHKANDSDTDPDAPVAQQMLSFVMDDPDFESEASDTPRIVKVMWQACWLLLLWLHLCLWHMRIPFRDL